METRFDFLSAKSMSGKKTEDKIEIIINRIKEGSVVVLERGFAPEDEMRLIHATLGEINNKFAGIEVASLEKYNGHGFKEKFVNKLFPKSPLTVVGPSKIVKKIQKNPESFSMWI